MEKEVIARYLLDFQEWGLPALISRELKSLIKASEELESEDLHG